MRDRAGIYAHMYASDKPCITRAETPITKWGKPIYIMKMMSYVPAIPAKLILYLTTCGIH